ncbi:S8 family serine peptidase [Allonocardiopsis opalescens]|uniref:Subtilase family protein n=1 Tax=Allonocardiopsis opalescens TaxID=1144618 RepID=A0A2T0QDT4_9ACTN|nr:S8 family serine peptidase [Allonocardiopsis opalescens]PRY02106.1 subtilase family protein [Allonocardiopsis opalescens]
MTHSWRRRGRAAARRAGAATAAAVLAAALAAVPAGAEPAPAAAAAERGASQVTLVTGDRVLIGPAAGDGAPSVRVRPAEGRERVGFQTRRRPDGHIVVLPSDAVEAVASGRVDERLFDVTQLVEWGYHDAGRGDVPLILRNESPAEAPGLAGLSAVEVLPDAGLTTASVDKGEAAAFWADLAGASDGTGEGAQAGLLAAGAERIWLDGVRQAYLEHSVPQIGAPEAWEAGYTGEGVTVAVLDTGVDAEHPELAGQVAAEENFTDAESADDLNGHGTHVASTIAGTGEGGYTGVAPGATIVSGKVLDDSGFGSESGIIAGMEWAAAEADIVNMSLGGTDGAGVDPLELAVDELSEQTGALFVIAAGNSGDGAQTVGSPGTADAALTVGAVDRDDRLADFSSRGPRTGDYAIKPEITAPGVDIVAAEANTDGHMAGSGTSMAAPHVAGAAALLAQRHPDWDGGALKNTLAATAVPTEGLTAYEQGAGRVSVPDAIAAQVVPDAAALSSAALWPHDEPESDEHTLTYTNRGDTELTLELAVTGAGAELFTVADTALTVPAGGTASTTVAVTVPAGIEPGPLDARLTATHAGGTVATPLAVYAEPPSADVTFEALGADGEPAPVTLLAIRGGEDPRVVDVYETEAGPATRRLEQGDYTILAYFDQGVGDSGLTRLAYLARELTVGDEPLTVELDAATAEPVELLRDPGDGLSVGSGRAEFVVDGVVGMGWGGVEPAVAPAEVAGLEAVLGADLTDAGPGEPITRLSSAVAAYSGGLPESPALDLRSASLARTDATLRSHGAADQEGLLGFASAAGLGGSAGYLTAAPATVEVGLTPGVWSPLYGYGYLPESDWFAYEAFGEPIDLPEAGQAAPLELNTAALGPSSRVWVGLRVDDTLVLDPAPNLFVPADGALAFPVLADGEMTVTRDGETLVSGPVDVQELQVPPEEAAYTVAVEAARETAGPGEVSPQVQVEWGFRSASVPGGQAELPTIGLTLAPEGLDERNRARAGGMTRVHVHPHSPAGSYVPAELSLQASTDGGETWQDLRVRRYGGHWAAQVRNPRSGAVSLRAAAADGEGNTVEQTVTDAYTVR